MHKVLVSSCLLGSKVCYDGRDLWEQNQILAKWAEESRVVEVCPRVLAALLAENQVKVFSQHTIARAAEYVHSLSE